MKMQPHRGQITPLHLVVIALSFSVTFTIWQYTKHQTEIKVQQRFEASRDRIVGLIENRMARYEDALWAGVSAMDSQGGDMTLEQWRLFTEKMRIGDKYPGINGIGVIHYLRPDMLDAYLDARGIERDVFQIFPDHDSDHMMPISFIEPEAANSAAIGLDIAHETNRRNAALASRDTGYAQITGPIVLVQDASSTPGFLFYAPIYKEGPLDTLEQRRASFSGTVYAPFVVNRLMDGLLAKHLRHVSVSISDADEVIYDEHLTAEDLHDDNPMFAEQVTLDLYGRQWRLDIRTNLAFRHNNSDMQPVLFLIAGVLIEVLVIALIIMMARTNKKAVAYAEKVTDALRSEKEKLVKSNVELEQFAYVISHDLKTPIRGIAGLADMLKEDLEDYCSSKDANPEVTTAIDLIHDRVQRMNDLTSGILEFSCIRETYGKDSPLELTDFITSMIADLDLEPDQLVLDTPVQTLTTDTINLRRVLENLIGNAVKYHDGRTPLRIRVCVEDKGDTFAFSVADNGPGIDVRYHKKIFEMFQTLRTCDTPESTGIGLAVVKKSVELHGGRVEIISHPGEGATFSFHWPRNATAPPRESTAA
ncbi:Adaptive-response sensory-kinase SasA [Roseobacter fucihabitans]|uniref:histidine kinase n=1 Tax=Roseobacter fucihabitans TaxID=1537242 RepID=A0ABZ2BRW9_9RHOB|nr:CHASE domain-containing protein [Roseobacter litoralis]MBC6965429.1 Phytochrome-like protein cph1 [Roseobacter litoralis]